MSAPLPGATIEPSSEGTIPFTYEGETYQTYFKVFGNLQNSTRRPLVAVHGGPGLSHDYLLPVSDLTKVADIPTIFYDQVGNSRSTHLREKPAEFWTIKLFIAELENLIKHFNIQDNYDLLGHSWGGQLISEFEVQKHPAGLKHLVITSSLTSMADWQQSNVQLLKEFPEDVQQGMIGGLADLKKYRWALGELHKKHGCLVRPFPKELEYGLDQVFSEQGDPSVAVGMFTKELSQWSIKDRLSTVRVPSLIQNGALDIAQDFVVEPFVKLIPNNTWIKYEHSSHTPHWEEREKFVKDVDAFLQ